jgi:hypothetical protein
MEFAISQSDENATMVAQGEKGLPQFFQHIMASGRNVSVNGKYFKDSVQ